MNYQRRSGFGAIPPVVKNLLIINGVFFLATIIAYNNYGYDLYTLLGLYYPESIHFSPYQFITHMFMHSSSNITHIFFNMFALWMFGKVLEQHWGGKKFIIYYMVTGIGAAAIHILAIYIGLTSFDTKLEAYKTNPTPEAFMEIAAKNFDDESKAYIYCMEISEQFAQNENDSQIYQLTLEVLNTIRSNKVNTPTVGASGAVFGILLAFGMLFPNVQLMLIFIPVPIKAKYFVMFYGAIELYFGYANNPGDNIAHFAHLGGMIFGFILIMIWRGNIRKKKNNGMPDYFR